LGDRFSAKWGVSLAHSNDVGGSTSWVAGHPERTSENPSYQR
jgi:hypothetical protein